MGGTYHWVDCEWNLQKSVIAFRVFDDQHTAHNIYRMIKVVLDEYDLINKIFAIDFNNASANTASIPELEKVCKPAFGDKFYHHICTCHVLNLCLQDGLKQLKDYIKPIRHALHYL